jgi:hypothetical protein
LKEEYGTAKRSPCFVDLKAGGVKQIGYVIGFRNKWRRDKADPVFEQHWIEFRECNLMDMSKTA